MFFVVRSNDSFNFPLWLIKYIVIVIVIVLLESEPVSLLELILHYSVPQLYDDTFNNNSSYLKREGGERKAMPSFFSVLAGLEVCTRKTWENPSTPRRRLGPASGRRIAICSHWVFSSYLLLFSLITFNEQCNCFWIKTKVVMDLRFSSFEIL